jgi:hypothetical protein
MGLAIANGKVILVHRRYRSEWKPHCFCGICRAAEEALKKAGSYQDIALAISQDQ